MQPPIPCAGTGVDLDIESLYAGPYATLVSNVDLGYGSRPWGQYGAGTESSSFNTYWNIKSSIMVRGWAAVY